MKSRLERKALGELLVEAYISTTLVRRFEGAPLAVLSALQDILTPEP